MMLPNPSSCYETARKKGISMIVYLVIAVQGHVYLVQMPVSVSTNVHSNSAGITSFLIAPIWPASSPAVQVFDQENSTCHHLANQMTVTFSAWKLHTAIWKCLKNKAWGPVMCAYVNGMMDWHQQEIWNASCPVQRQYFSNSWPLFSPPTDMGWGGVTQDITAHASEEFLKHKEGRHRLWGHMWLEFVGN